MAVPVLPVLRHRAIALVALSSPGIEDVLIAIAARFAQTAYQNAGYGTRTAGADKAWTATAVDVSGTIEAVVLRPPEGDIDDVAIILAGSASARTPTMASPDSYAADGLLMAVCKGVPTDAVIDDWTSATPFGAGSYTFSGFWRCAATSVANYASLCVYESQETVHIALHRSNIGTLFGAGALWDGYGYAESNGRLIGMWVTGGDNTFAFVQQSMWVGSTSSGGAPLQHTPTGQRSHVMYFEPGTANLVTNVNRMGTNISVAAANLITGNGNYIGLPVLMEEDNRAVRAREIFIGPDAVHGHVLVDADNIERGYCLSRAVDAANDAMILAT